MKASLAVQKLNQPNKQSSWKSTEPNFRGEFKTLRNFTFRSGYLCSIPLLMKGGKKRTTIRTTIFTFLNSLLSYIDKDPLQDFLGQRKGRELITEKDIDQSQLTPQKTISAVL